MKSTTIFVLGGAALLLFYLGNLGVVGNVLQYYIQTVSFQGLTSGRIVMMVQNPSNTNVTLNSMAGTITANGVQIGNISNFQGGVSIPANSQQTVTIFVSLSLTGVVSELFSALTQPTGQNQIDFLITGNANINGGIIVPFNIDQTVTV